MTNEEAIAKLTELMQAQSARMDEERRASIEREERMQTLLENALDKVPKVPVPAVEESHGKNKIPTNATPAPMLLHNASLREFTTWKQKFNDYRLLTGISKVPNNQQKAVLRSLLDDEWFRVTKFALAINMESEDTTVETIIEQMQQHLRSQRNVVLDRKEFYMRNQQQDEKFDDYFIALQEIAGFCDFCKHCLNQQYRDRIVTGVQNEETVKDLLSTKDLTLDKAVALCRANENANQDTEKLQATASGINRVSRYQNQKPKQYAMSDYENKSRRQNWENRKPQSRSCKFCGGAWHEKLSQCPAYQHQPQEKQNFKQHNKYSNDKFKGRPWENKFQNKRCRFCGGEWHEQLEMCPAKDKNCGSCGEQGHFARFCINALSDEEYDSGNTWRIIVAGVMKRLTGRKLRK